MDKDYLYFRELYRDELYHHGVKGQKWGVRNEKEEEHKRKEAAAKKKEREHYEKTTTGKELARSILPGTAWTTAALGGIIGAMTLDTAYYYKKDPAFAARVNEYASDGHTQNFMRATLAGMGLAGVGISTAVGIRRAKYAKQVQAQAKQKSK